MLLWLLGIIRTATPEFICILLVRNPQFAGDHPPSVKDIVVYLKKKLRQSSSRALWDSFLEARGPQDGELWSFLESRNFASKGMKDKQQLTAGPSLAFVSIRTATYGLVVYWPCALFGQYVSALGDVIRKTASACIFHCLYLFILLLCS